MPSVPYSGDPASTTKDLVRFLLQDVATIQLLTDAEIAFLLVEWVNPYLAAAEAATVLGARFSGQSDKTVGPLSIKYSEQSNRYFELAKNLRGRSSRNSGALAITTQVPDRGPTFIRDGMQNSGNYAPELPQ